MKVNKTALGAVVCTALMGAQTVVAEEQQFFAENMGFALGNTQGSAAQMSELSGVEMSETKGANYCQDLQAQGFFIGCFDSLEYIVSPSWDFR